MEIPTEIGISSLRLPCEDGRMATPPKAPDPALVRRKDRADRIQAAADLCADEADCDILLGPVFS